MYKIYPWQQQQWEYLLARHKQNNLPHALLFSGMAGLGKLDFAKAFAELLLCKESSRGAANSACGNCVACKLIAANNHPDLLLIQPEKEGGIIKIDQIRTLIADLSNTAQQGGYQVVIISPANAMNTASANALLKTLEEPMGQTIIILLSDRPTVLPATIRSRCQLLSFSVPSTAETLKWLQEKSSATVATSVTNDVSLALNVSQGSPLQALALLKDQQIKNYEKLRQEIIDVMQKKMYALNFAVEHADDDIQLIATIFLSLIMDVIKLHFNPSEKFLLNQDKLAVLTQLQKKTVLADLFAFCDYLLQLNKMLHEHINFNRQLLLESLCLRYAG